MIKLENFEVVGWEHAIRGMRNPMNSWEKSDSVAPMKCRNCGVLKNKDSLMAKQMTCAYCKKLEGHVGPNDHDLMMRLRNAGTDHRKFMRMTTVYIDITAPLYWWKEFDTYKVGTVANSCSTMHKIHEKEFTLEDFSHEHLLYDAIHCINRKGFDDACKIVTNPKRMLELTVESLNVCRHLYLETKDKTYWWQMIQLLPSSYNQKRTVMLNYEVLANIYKSRKNHKLDEWREFCEWIEGLPYSEIITGADVKEDTTNA